jgi:hypothetical protein
VNRENFARQPVIVFTVMQERVPESLRGRVVRLTNTLAFSAAPLGILAANWSSSTPGLRSTLMIFAGLYFVLVVAALLSPSLADLNTATGTQRLGRCSGRFISGADHRLRAITASATSTPKAPRTATLVLWLPVDLRRPVDLWRGKADY